MKLSMRMNSEPVRNISNVTSKVGGNDEIRSLKKRIRQLEIQLAENQQTGMGHSGNESRIDDFAGAMCSWFWETDADHRFTYFSPSVFDITGVPPEWHYGKTREEIGNPESVSKDVWEKHLQTITRQLPFSDFVFERQGPDGSQWMRTSGKPVFDDNGIFQGYRGAASDITVEIKAENRAGQLVDAIRELNEIFVLWGSDDRLVVCNEKFREINSGVIEATAPGTLFADHIKSALWAGLYPNAVGLEEDWYQDRLARHLNPTGPFELERQDGRWLLLDEQRLRDGSVVTISTDITERKRIEQAIKKKNQFLETSRRTIPDGVQVLDEDLSLVAWNDQLFEVLDLDGPAILSDANPGKAFRYALAGRGEYGEGDIEELVASREAIARTRVPAQYERQLVRGKWMECRGSSITGGGYVAVYRDIDESKRIQEKLEQLASTDALTNISNRRSFMEIATSEFHRTKRYERPLAFLLLDIDHFKSVNDKHGHAVGDETLRYMVSACQNVLRSSDLIGRFGDEEFVVMLPETNSKGAVLMAERLRQAVADMSVPLEAGELQVTVSIGIAMTCTKHSSPEDVISDADAALYMAKRGGRNRVSQYR